MFVSFHTSPLETPGSRDAGGLNVSLLGLAHGLGRRGHQVVIVTRRAETDGDDVVNIAPNVEVHKLRAGPERPLPIAGLTEYLDEFAQRLEELLGIFAPVEIVHSHYWLSGVSAERALRGFTSPLESPVESPLPLHVLSLHTLGSEKVALTGQQSSHMRERINAERALLTDPGISLVASSEAEAQAMTRFGALNVTRISVLRPGVDTELFRPRATWDESQTLRCVVVGRIQPYKGQHFALDVFALVRDALAHRNLELRFIGSPTSHPDDARYFNALQERVVSLNLSKEVRFTGAASRTETARELADATLTLIPSLSETFGLVALESAAAGTPVIAESVGGLRESVSDGVSGLLMHSRDPAQWAAAICELVTDDTRLSAMRESARNVALARDWDAMAQDAEMLYARLLGSRSATNAPR